MIVAQHRVMPQKLSGLAYGIGVGGFFGFYFRGMFTGVWFMRALPLFIGFFSALITWRERRFHRRTAYRWFLLQGPALWVAIEFLRGVVPVIGTWGFAPYALYDQPWLIQPVSVMSIYGLSFLIIMVNYALGFVALKLFDDADLNVSWSQVGSRTLLAALCLFLWIGVSVLIDRTSSFADSQSVRVAAIHPAFKVQSDEGVQKLIDLTRDAASEGAELVVWNEGALPFNPQQSHTDALQSLTTEADVHLVIGYAYEAERGYRNEAVILTPQGSFLGPYGKAHPVAWSGETSVTSGPYRAYSTALGRLGMIICYDLDFTDSARQVARSGAQLVAVPSFDWKKIASKHYTHLVFRAVENRVAMVKADVGFDSAIIDPSGRILERTVTPKPEADILIADLPLGSGNAPLIRLGDWFGYLAVAGMLVFVAFDLIVARARSRRQA
jgi:apolipoprotein N-acyltransferase